MGKILDSWLARNSQVLQTLAPGGGVRAPAGVPPLSYAPQPALEPGFGVRAPTQASSFEGMTPIPNAPRGVGLNDMTPIPNATDTGSFDVRKLTPVPVAPTNPERAQVTPPPGAPKGGEKPYGLKDMLQEMSDEELENASKLMEGTGTTPREAYTRITGSPPPADMKKRDLSTFLLEFGLGLLAAPAGSSDAEAFGAAGLGALRGHQQRVSSRAEQARADEQTQYERDRDRIEDERAERRYREERIDKSFDRQTKIAELQIRQQEAEARIGRPTNAQFNHYVGDDGFMYTYDEATGQGVRVEVNGQPVKPDPKSASGDRKLDFEVKYNMYLDTYGVRPDGSKITGSELQSVQRRALEFANRTNDYTEAEAQREAVKGAVDLLAKDTNYLMADPDEKSAMRNSLTNELKNLYLGRGGAQGGEPDASKLVQGMATPVTDEKGNTVYWTLGEDNKPRRVDQSELE